MRTRYGVTLLGSIAGTGALTLASFQAPRTEQPVAQGNQVPVIIEFAVPDNLGQNLQWPGSGSPVVSGTGLTPTALNERLNQLQRPPLPSFEPSRAPFALFTVTKDPAGTTISARRYCQCGTVSPQGYEEIKKRSDVKAYKNYALLAKAPIVKAPSPNNISSAIGIASLKTKGEGVLVGIVDSGFDASLRAQSPTTCGATKTLPCFNKDFSLGAHAGTVGGTAAHGQMVAYDVTIVAPEVTLADVDTGSGALCDALDAYQTWIRQIGSGKLTGYNGAVMVNAWQVYASDPEFLDYRDKADHPVNAAIGELNKLGVDIVFAAGNCGSSPYPKCLDNGRMIYGANSHPDVLTVGAATFKGTKAKYSVIGDGYLEPQKPDVLTYSGYLGLNASASQQDTGTSAAAPLVAGLIATLRSQTPYDPNDKSTFPAELRQKVRNAACRVPGMVASGHDLKYGWGLVKAGCLP